MEPLNPIILRKLLDGEFASAKEARRVLLDAEAHGVDDEKLKQARLVVSRLELEEAQKEQFERLFDIAPKGWFRDYLKYCKASESPMLFHLMNAITLASHHVSRRRYFFLTGQNIYAPVSVFLCSPAGLAGRGQSIAQLGRVVRHARSKVLIDKATPEGLLKYLAENPHTLFISEEASLLLNPKDYMSDMTQTLCRLVDGDDVFGVGELTKAAGATAIKGVTLNMLLSSSPGMLISMPRTAISGGLLSRLILVWAHRTERMVPFPDDVVSEEEHERKAKELGTTLRERTRKLKTAPIKYIGSTKRYYALWYTDNSRMKASASSKMTHWYGRRAAHLHRICATMEAINTGSWEISQDTLDRTIALIDVVEEEMENVYRSASLSLPEQRMQAVINCLAGKGGVATPSEVYASVYGKFDRREQFDQLVADLVDLKFVCFEKFTRRKGARPVKVLRLLRKL